MKSPSVLHVIGQFTVGGAEKQLARAASLQATGGRRVSICVLDGELSPSLVRRARPCPVIKLESGRGRLARARALDDLLRAGGWELAAGQLFSGNLYAVWAARWAGVPAVVFEGGLETWSRPWHWAVCRWYWRRSELIEVNAAAVGDNVRSHGGEPTKLRLIYNGIEAPPDLSPAERRKARRELGLNDEHLVVMLANLHPPKDPFTLIRAVGGLSTSRGPASLILAGDGPQRGRVEELIEELDLEDRVRLVGRLDDVRPLLAAADAACLSSRAEGLSNAVIEALASGVPCAATRAGGNAELLGDGARGALFEPGDVAGCREALRSLLDDGENARHRAEQARRWVLEELSFERNIQRRDRLYAEALERWRSRNPGRGSR
ncbi:MAG: glycosyltransferase [Candidatus Coatesbacteria bacterium]|nr:glycosyltransferase [Candidatus Coatesbacteria bacterium]